MKINGPDSLSKTFANCRKQGKKALMPFLTSGYPDGATFVSLLKRFSQAGADVIEIGIPFSDPLADGRTIQYSSQIALDNGVTVDKTFDYLSALGDSFRTPLIIMSYLNPLNHYGLNRLVQRAHACGVRGLIIPDLIPEEGHETERICSSGGIDLIYLLAPTSSRERRQLILTRSSGFVYLVSVAGVTGARTVLPKRLGSWLSQVKNESRLPVCVGFGISNVDQARTLSRNTDGVIVGSAIIDRIRNSPNRSRMVSEATSLIRNLRKGLDND